MRGFKRSPWLTGLGVLLTSLTVSAGQVRADAGSDSRGSVLVFPKLVANAGQDTLVQITNTITSAIKVHCVYVQKSPCAVGNFDVVLTAQQPTFWRVSTGRGPGFLSEPPCRVGDPNCSCRVVDLGGGVKTIKCPGFDTWFGIGAPEPPPQPTGFDGAMYCYEIHPVDENVVGRNALKGEAVIETMATGDIAAYNAIAISGEGVDDAGAVIDLDGGEFNACPNRLVVNHPAEMFADPAFAVGANVSVTTEISLVPCTIDLRTGGGSADFSLWFHDEYEQPGSIHGLSSGCVFRQTLTAIDPDAFKVATRTTTMATEVEGVDLEGDGLLGIAIETHTVTLPDGSKTTVSAGYNLNAVYEGDPRLDGITPSDLF